MGSVEAMKQGSKDRYFQGVGGRYFKKIGTEGIVGRVSYKGSEKKVYTVQLEFTCRNWVIAVQGTLATLQETGLDC